MSQVLDDLLAAIDQLRNAVPEPHRHLVGPRDLARAEVADLGEVVYARCADCFQIITLT